MDNIKLVIFDLDGTLINAYKAITMSFNYAMLKLKLPAQDELTICKAVGWGDENLLKPFAGKKLTKKALIFYRRHHKGALLKYARLFPGVKKMLGGLRNKGYKIAVASNRPTKFSLILLRHLGIKKYFDFVLCKDALKYGKPHPMMINKIIKHFSLNPEQAVYVGDMAIDAQAARRARVKGIMGTCGSSTREELKKEKPYRIINRISDLEKIL